MTSYWKSTHSTPTKKQPDIGDKEASLLSTTAQSLVQNAAQKKETTAKAEIKEAQVRQGFDH